MNTEFVLQRRNNRFLQAKKDFLPERILKHLKRASDGTVYFDRSILVTDRESTIRFYYMLDRIYLAGWKDVENLTAYFEINGYVIVAGGYNIITCEKTSKRCLISTNATTPYTCFEHNMKRYIELIIEAQKAPQRAK